MVKFLFVLSMFLIPFSDFTGIPGLGEIQHETSAYTFIMAMVVGIFTAIQAANKGSQSEGFAQAYLLPKIMAALLIVIFISFVMNFSGMLADRFRGRYAPLKFLTSVSIVIYGFALAYLSYFMAKRYRWQDIIIKPVGLSIIVCSVVGVIEMFSWYGGPTLGLYTALSKIIHTGSGSNINASFIGGMFGWGQTEGRARSVCFEAPALANFAGFAWPWAYAGFSGNRGRQRAIYFGIWMLVNGIMIGAASRTGVVLLIANFFVLLMLRFIYLPPRPRHDGIATLCTFAFWCFIVIGIGVFVYNADDIANQIAMSTNVSNISRYSSMTAAFRMFEDTPVWGYGFGQYGFHVLKYMPSWGYYSWEIRAWFTNPMVVWPPVFSMYARLAAETGLLGLITWIGIWYTVARLLVKETIRFQKLTGAFPVRAYPLVTSCFCVLFSGIPSDTLRTPMMWISLGLACSYLHEIKTYMARQRTEGAQQNALQMPGDAMPDGATRPASV